MRRRILPVLLVVAALLVWTTLASAFPVDVYSENDPSQDYLNVNGSVHELGDQAPFPNDEWIISSWLETDYRPCPQNPDTGIPNVEVSITNMTGIDWANLYYVADPETSLQNYDGFIGNAGFADAQFAFKIDWVGINTPLVYESLNVNGVFEATETWKFVIQDFFNTLGGPPAPFDSLGIASVSGGWSPSTGSIITPEPSTLALLFAAGVMALLVHLKRRRK